MPQPRTPTQLKLLRGNPGKQRINPEPMPLHPVIVPDPPDFLLPTAKDEWWRIAEELKRLRILTIADIRPLAAYCQAYARWSAAEEAVAKMATGDAVTGAMMLRSTKGGAQANPLIKIAMNAARDMVKYASEFGLTPVARARIAAGYAADESKSKFAGLLAG